MTAPPSPDAVALRLHRHLSERLRRAGHAQTVGPFLLGLDPDDANPFRNYALPGVGAEPRPADIAALVSRFRSADRQPRLEWFPDCAPGVEAALRAAGFEEELRPPVMTWRADTPGRGAAPVAGIRMTVVDPDAGEDVAGTCVVAHLAFEEEGMPDELDLQRLATMLRQGGGAVLARTRSGDDAVGSAQHTVPAAGAVEIVGVAVLPGHRRRGIASAMTSALAALAQRRGVGLTWLSPGGPDAERVYRRAGFETCIHALHMRHPG